MIKSIDPNRCAQKLGFFLIIFSILCCTTGNCQTIQIAVDQISTSQYQSYHSAIENCGLGLYSSAYNQGYRNRDGWAGGGTLGNQEAALYLSDNFLTMGLNTSIQGTYKNVVAELAGSVTPEKIYVVGGHYDTYGSGDYVNNSVLAQNETIAGMINLDMILRPGWDSNPLESMDLDIITKNTSACFDWADTFMTAAQTYSPLLNFDVLHTANWDAGDQGPFLSADFPAVMVIENTANEVWYQNSNIYYHSSQDASDDMANNPFNPSGITYDYDFASDILRTTVATLAQEAVLIPEPATLLLLGLGGLILKKRR